MGSPATSTRTSSALLTGLVSLIGALLGGWLAFQLYAAVAPPLDSDIDLVDATFRLIGRLMIAALVAMGGFVVGSISAMAIELTARRADRALLAVGLALIAEITLVPAAAFAVVWVSETGADSPLWLWLAAAIVGGGIPGLARWLTFRPPAGAG